MASSSHHEAATVMRTDSSSSSTPSRQQSHRIPSSFRASPSPSATSQSDDQDRDDEDEEDLEEEEEEEGYTDIGPSNFGFNKERRNTLKARGSAALPVSAPAINSSETWRMSPASARNASAATLPHEILLHIFRYVSSNPVDLRNSLTVCKSWCLCGVELLWHRPSFHKISSLFQMIHTIRRSDQTFPYAKFVRRLNLAGLANDLEDSLFSRLVACTRLERLMLPGCELISDDAIAALLSQLKHLVAADFSEVKQLTDNSVMKLAQNCPRLQGVNFTGCKNITSSSIAAMARNCHLLRRVKLSRCTLVGDEGLVALAQNCPVLLEMDLINCPLVTDNSVRELWKGSFHMREMRLAQCGQLTDLAFPAPNSSVGGMSAANLIGMGSTALSPSSAVRQVSSLQQQQQYHRGSDSAPISRHASPITNASRNEPDYHSRHHQSFSASDDNSARTSSMTMYEPLHTHLRVIRMFDHLRILDLTNCDTISDAAIEGIISNVPRLRNLILAKCTRLTNESVFSISRLGKNLHYLHLGHVSNLTDEAVCHLAHSCTRLRYIDLACCPQLTDLSVLELAANLPKLRRIGLVRVTNLTDQAIYSLVERYTSLERIHLSYCENVSVAAIFWLLERLNRLTHLSLTGVPSFRKPELQAMCREPPREFNAHQRSAFCVYSGKGVHQLRKFLQYTFYSKGADGSPSLHHAPEVQRVRNHLTTEAQQQQYFNSNHHRSANAWPATQQETPTAMFAGQGRTLSEATLSGPASSVPAATADYHSHQQQQQQPHHQHSQMADLATPTLTTSDSYFGRGPSMFTEISSTNLPTNHTVSRSNAAAPTIDTASPSLANAYSLNSQQHARDREGGDQQGRTTADTSSSLSPSMSQ